MMEFLDLLWTWYMSLFEHVFPKEGDLRILNWGYPQVAFFVSVVSATCMFPSAWSAASHSGEMFGNSLMITGVSIVIGLSWPVLAAVVLAVLGVAIAFTILAVPSAVISLVYENLESMDGAQ